MESIRSKYVISDNGCWEWSGALRAGYGVLKRAGKSISAHRYSYEASFGKIPDGLLVCHKCDNRKCVNPNHLFLGTYKDNMQDCKNKGRLVVPIGKNPYKKGHRALNTSLSDDVVLDIIQKINSGIRLIDISRQLNVKYQTIRDINCGRSYITIVAKFPLTNRVSVGRRPGSHPENTGVSGFDGK